MFTSFPPSRVTRRAPVAALVLLATLAACGDDGIGPPLGAPGLHVVSGDGTSDTVEAAQVAPLVVELRDERGAPRPGVQVAFAALPATPPSMIVRSAAGTGFVGVDTTDASGRASVGVTFGRVAGPAAIEVRVLALDLRDTARFTVLPGAATATVVEPADTVVMIGGTARLRGSARDRFGNARADAVQWSVVSGAVSVGSAGDVPVTTPGFARVAASFGGRADTAVVVGAPVGLLSGFTASTPGGPVSVVLFDVDGMRRRTLIQRNDGSLGSEDWVQDWSATTPTMFFAVGPRLHALDTLGALRRLLPDDAVAQTQSRPAASRDGAWVYFYGDGQLWRVRPDGGGLAPLATGRTGMDSDMHPSPSPDGTRVVFSSMRGGSSVASLFVLTLATGQVTPLGVGGYMPRWSPTGERIAYFDWVRDELRVVGVDGTGDRTLGRSLGYPFSWSPDGRWIVGRGDNPSAMLVDVSTGERARVPGTDGLRSPGWAR